MEVLKEEADRMNAANVKKLPKLTESGEEDWSETEDPSFNETNRKPIMLKIKKENEDEQSRSVAVKKIRYFRSFKVTFNNNLLLRSFGSFLIKKNIKLRSKLLIVVSWLLKKYLLKTNFFLKRDLTGNTDYFKYSLDLIFLRRSMLIEKD